MTINPFTARAKAKARAGPTGPSRRRLRGLMLGGVVAAGLVGTILVPASAHAGTQDARPAATATAADGDVTVQFSRGFLIYNLSSHPLKLINISGDGKFEGRPEDGAVLMPGVGYHDIEVQWVWLSNQANTATYASPIKDLAAYFGVHRTTITALLQRHDVELRQVGLNEHQVEHARWLYRDGWSLARLGERFGVDDMTVRRYLLLAGVVMRSPHERRR